MILVLALFLAAITWRLLRAGLAFLARLVLLILAIALAALLGSCSSMPARVVEASGTGSTPQAATAAALSSALAQVCGLQIQIHVSTEVLNEDSQDFRYSSQHLGAGVVESYSVELEPLQDNFQARVRAKILTPGSCPDRRGQLLIVDAGETRSLHSELAEALATELTNSLAISSAISKGTAPELASGLGITVLSVFGHPDGGYSYHLADSEGTLLQGHASSAGDWWTLRRIMIALQGLKVHSNEGEWIRILSPEPGLVRVGDVFEVLQEHSGRAPRYEPVATIQIVAVTQSGCYARAEFGQYPREDLKFVRKGMRLLLAGG